MIAFKLHEHCLWENISNTYWKTLAGARKEKERLVRKALKDAGKLEPIALAKYKEYLEKKLIHIKKIRIR